MQLWVFGNSAMIARGANAQSSKNSQARTRKRKKIEGKKRPKWTRTKDALGNIS
jgi:hypothetical protein